MKNMKDAIKPDKDTPLPIDFYVNRLELASRTTLWRWTKEGLRTHRIGGRVYISQAELQRFMNEMSPKPVAE
jgi:hypothetical protein